MRRLMLVVAALTIPVAAASVGLSGPAGASAPVSCSKVSGNLGTSLTFGGCGGGLGKGSAVAPGAISSPTTLTIAWKGKHKGTTTISVTVTSPPTSACKTGSTEYDASGTVTADTSGKVAVTSAVSGKACVDSSGNVSLVKHTTFVL